MTTNPIRFNPGDWLHIGQIVVMLITLGVFVGSVINTQHQVDRHTHQLDRIEHYLSSRDPEYWQLTKE